MSELLPQAHGGALMPPWHKRDHRPANGPAAGRTSLKKLNREVHDILATNAPGLAQRMIDGALETDDIRAVAVVTTVVLAHVQGKPTERPQNFDGAGGGTLDTSLLTAEETADALACCERLAAYLALVEERKRGGGRIETQT